MAANAQARASAEPARRRPQVAPAPRRAAPPTPRLRTRSQRAKQARVPRLLVVFAIALTVLAVGRIALSFAVVQKTMATESVAAEQSRIVAENAQLTADVTRLSSMTRIRSIALRSLDLVVSSGVVYLSVDTGAADAGAAER